MFAVGAEYNSSKRASAGLSYLRLPPVLSMSVSKPAVEKEVLEKALTVLCSELQAYGYEFQGDPREESRKMFMHLTPETQQEYLDTAMQRLHRFTLSDCFRRQDPKAKRLAEVQRKRREALQQESKLDSLSEESETDIRDTKGANQAGCNNLDHTSREVTSKPFASPATMLAMWQMMFELVQSMQPAQMTASPGKGELLSQLTQMQGQSAKSYSPLPSPFAELHKMTVSHSSADQGKPSSVQGAAANIPMELTALIGKKAGAGETSRIVAPSQGGGCLKVEAVIDLAKKYPLAFAFVQEEEAQCKRLTDFHGNPTHLQIRSSFGNAIVNFHETTNSVSVQGVDTALGVCLVKDWTVVNNMAPKSSKRRRKTA